MNVAERHAPADEYLELVHATDERGGGRRDAWERMKASSAYVGGAPAPISYLPRILDQRTRDQLASTALTVHGILEKVIAAYLDDPQFRELFSFDERVRDLILAPRASARLLPYARFDCFFDEDSGAARFVEFNADCSSGMNKTRAALDALRPSAPCQAFAARHRLEDDAERLFEGWVADFMRLYGACEGAKEHPHVAIVMCMDGDDVPLGELSRYAALFRAAGADASVCDVRDLAFEGGRLACATPREGAPNQPIDVVWRFCIVVDLLQHWDDCQDFVTAVTSGAVPMIGSFATQVAHDKQLFAVLRDPAAQALLTPAERAFVEESLPFTAFLDDPRLPVDQVLEEPARWVIKPTDWYDNKGVYVGAQFSRAEWADVVERCRADAGPSAYLVQEFCAPARTPAIPLYGDEADFSGPVRDFGCLTGLYVFDGQFAGVYNRLGPTENVTAPGTFVVAPTLWVQDE
ncbi:carboxylate--amine ligase [Adlercreutzia sp. ZJ242]|uniref:carboxylate--amine ligase n=1 Tax=Adlercreutzia sp. ZJ242 TaxID=2709409 RepID=UPI0013EB94BA|nr:carboxylate--amine ligase [Adlercreutzia sp. ZJ242]